MEIYQNLSLENLPNEEWRDVVGYEGLYKVSNHGRVKSIKEFDSKGRKKKEKILKQTISKVGYLCINIYASNGKCIVWNVHVLVAKAFIDNIENKPCIDHINTIRVDNRVENLRWVTYSENNKNPITNKRMKDFHKDKCNTIEGKQKMKKISLLAFTEEAKAKRRETIKRPEIRSKWTKALGQPVIQYTMDDQFIAEYECIREAQYATGFFHISDVCLGKRNHAGGYKWKYKQI